MALMVLAGKRYYPINVDVPVFGFAMALLISTWSILSIGFLIASIVPTARFAQPIGAAILYPMLALCGLFVPLQSLPPALRAVARVVPLTYAVSLLQGIWKGEAVVGAYWRRRGAGGRIRDLHGALGEGVSLGVARPAELVLQSLSQAQIPHQPQERIRMQAEHLGGSFVVSVGFVPCTQDRIAFGVADRGLIGSGQARRGSSFQHRFGKIFGQNLLGFAQHHGALDCIFELADIAGPGIGDR